MKAYNTYIFDLDGTITDTTVEWLDIIRDLLRQFHVEPPADDKVLAQHTHDWKQMLLLGLAESDLEAFTKQAYVLANERLPKAQLHVGAYEMLESLRNKGKQLAIFSTMDSPIFEPAMRARNLYSVVDVAVSGTDVPRRKPHPDGILKALTDLGITKGEYKHAVYIGDKDTDIQAAHNAGIDAMLFYPPAHQLLYSIHELQKHKPEYVISDWKELIV